MMKKLLRTLTVALAATIMTLTATTASANDSYYELADMDYLGMAAEAFEEADNTSDNEEIYYLSDDEEAYYITDTEVIVESDDCSYEAEAFPYVVVQISGEYGTTWCKQGTDGYFYNEYGYRFVERSLGIFEDIMGNEYFAL